MEPQQQTDSSDPIQKDQPAHEEAGGRKSKSPLINWKLFAAVFAIAVVLIVYHSTHATANIATSGSNLMTVPVVKITRENLFHNRTFEAEFRPYQAIDLHANVAGFVKSIKVDIGDRVKAGDVLAELSIPELKEDTERAVAAELRDEKKVDEAAAAYADAHLSCTRLVTINERQPHLIAKQDLDTAQAKDHSAEAALAAAKQDVLVAKADVARLKTISDFCTITAPFSGVITKRYADEGALVQGGVNPSGAALPLVRLSQNDRLRLDFPVSVSCVQFISVGDPVEIKVLGTGQTIPGKISRFTRDVDMATRTMEAEVDVTNSDLSLTPGIYAEVTLKLERRENALAIPNEALASLKSPTALVLSADNKVEERPITLGLPTEDKFEVISGLKENDLVIIGSRSKIEPGQKVEPKLRQIGGDL